MQPHHLHRVDFVAVVGFVVDGVVGVVGDGGSSLEGTQSRHPYVVAMAASVGVVVIAAVCGLAL